jgi:hypothetical protein
MAPEISARLASVFAPNGLRFARIAPTEPHLGMTRRGAVHNVPPRRFRAAQLTRQSALRSLGFLKRCAPTVRRPGLIAPSDLG